MSHRRRPTILISSWVSKLRAFIIFFTCQCLKFVIGYSFGCIVWQLMFEPYTRYVDFKLGSYILVSVFSLAWALLYLFFRQIRAITILFIPNMVGTASQNYILTMMIVLMLSNPILNTGKNIVESTRVIGCSIALTFDNTKERARLLLNPVIHALTESTNDTLVSVKNELGLIQNLVDDIKNEANFADISIKPVSTSDTLTNPLEQIKAIKNSSKFKFDKDNMSLNLSLNKTKLLDSLPPNLGKVNDYSNMNMTKVLYDSCMGMFQNTKGGCEEATKNIVKSCYDESTSSFSFLWCEPRKLGASICGFLVGQLVDEKEICNKLVAPSSTKTDDENEINHLYQQLAYKMSKFTEDISTDETDYINSPKNENQAIEFKVSFNQQTKALFMQTTLLIEYIKNKYRMRKFFVDIIVFLYDLTTTISFIFIMKAAYTYHSNYKRDANLSFDNYYITGQFYNLDSIQKRNEKPSVLPLDEEEMRKYITTLTCSRLTKEERKTQKGNCYILCLLIGISFSVMYLDDIFTSILRSIRDHSFIRINQRGKHMLNLKINGVGFVAQLVRKITEKFNSELDIDRTTTTEECLPANNSTQASFYYQFIGLILAYFVIDQCSVYAMRFRRLTCAYFYPEIETKRIIYLYKHILRERKNIEDLNLRSYNQGETGENDNKVADITRSLSLRDALSHLGKCITTSATCCSSR